MFPGKGSTETLSQVEHLAERGFGGPVRDGFVFTHDDHRVEVSVRSMGNVEDADPRFSGNVFQSRENCRELVTWHANVADRNAAKAFKRWNRFPSRGDERIRVSRVNGLLDVAGKRFDGLEEDILFQEGAVSVGLGQQEGAAL